MSQGFGQFGVAPPKRTFLDGRAVPSASVAEHAYLGSSGPLPPVPPSPQTARPQTSGAQSRGGGGGGGVGMRPVAEMNSYNKMVVSPVPPSPAALTAQGAGPKTTEAVLLVEYKVELTDILHESLSLLDNVYRTKYIFGDHLRYVDPSFTGDAVHQMNLLTPPSFDPTYQASLGSSFPLGMMTPMMMSGAMGFSQGGMGLSSLGSIGRPSGMSSEGFSKGRVDSGGVAQLTGSGNANNNNTNPGSTPNNAAGSAMGLEGATGAGNNNVGNDQGPSSNGTVGGQSSSQQANATTSQQQQREEKLKQRLRTAEVFIKKLYNRTAQLDTEVAFYKDELRRMETLCGLSRSPATNLSVTDGHIPLNHPLYAPAMRRRCRSAPPSRTLLRTAIGGYGLGFPFPTSSSGPSVGASGVSAGGIGGDILKGASGRSGVDSLPISTTGFSSMSQNPFRKRRPQHGGGVRRSRRRRSGPFNNNGASSGDEDGYDEESGEDDDDDALNLGGASTAYSVAATDAANAAVQGMRKRIMQLTEAVVMLQHENTTLRSEKSSRLTYRDALLTEYIVTRDRALAQLRASLQDAVTKVSNPMRLLRARQPNPGTNPAVATNNILLEVYQRLASEINVLVGDIVAGGASALVNTNAVLAGGSAGGAGGGAVGQSATGAQRTTNRGDLMDGSMEYEDKIGGGGSFAFYDKSSAGGVFGGAHSQGGAALPSGNTHRLGTGTGGSRSVLPSIEVGRVVGPSRPGTSGGGPGLGSGGGGIDGAGLFGGEGASAPSGNSRRVSGAASAGDADMEGNGAGGSSYFSGGPAASVVSAGTNNYLLTCHGCGTCVPLSASCVPGDRSTSGAPTAAIAVVGGGAALALAGGAGDYAATNARRGGAGTGGSGGGVGSDPQIDNLLAVLGGGPDDGLLSAGVLSSALVGGGRDAATGGGGGLQPSLTTAGGLHQQHSANTTGALPIHCSLSQSAAKRRELLTRLRPIADALPLQRRKQLVYLMCELRHLFDCLVLAHRTLLSRYDDDRKDAHRQIVQLRVNESMLRDQIGELEARLEAIASVAKRQEHAIQQAAIAARGY